MSKGSYVNSISIDTADSGFYQGFNRVVTIGSKCLILALVLWSLIFPEQSVAVLVAIKDAVLSNFGAYYIYLMAFFVFFSFALALIPSTGRIRLGGKDAKPEFSRFSWIAMMFGAAIGIGMLTYSTGEPLYHFASNPDTISGLVPAHSQETLQSVYRYAFFHWGLSAWCSFSVIGLALGYFSFNRGMPLTIRSGLSSLFGRSLNGTVGHIVDISAVLATLLGVAVTIGFGVSQLTSGLYNITGAEWMMNESNPTLPALLIALFVVMALSTLSAVSGVGKGIKWLSNINMSLSYVLLLFFLVFGSTFVALKLLGEGLLGYFAGFMALSLNVADQGTPVGDWQNGWTILYWAWWIAFAPFVGMFFAQISRGRTIREFVFGAVLLPSLVCFVWFTLVGGTAIDMELSGRAAGSIINANISSQIYETFNVMLSAGAAKFMSVIVVILLLTFLVTSADSAVLVINTINSGGEAGKNNRLHIVVWGVALTTVIAVLLGAGGLNALKTAMIIGSLPFSLIMLLMAFALVKDIFLSRRF